METPEGKMKQRPRLTEFVTPGGFKLVMTDVPLVVPLDAVKIFSARGDDVLIAAYPRAGATWVQEISWLICNQADTEEAQKSSVFARCPSLESFDMGDVMKGIQSLDAWPTDKQRIIKTQLPLEALPDQFVGEKALGKVIIVARNPKDVCVSYYYFHLMNAFLPESGNWDEFLRKFSSGEVHNGSWFQHTLKYWEECGKQKDRIHFVTYEELKKDLPSQITSLAKFLGKELTEQQIARIAEHCSFESMSVNKQTNASQAIGVLDFEVSKFLRKGQVGDWKNRFTARQSEDFDKLYAEKVTHKGPTMLFEI